MHDRTTRSYHLPDLVQLMVLGPLDLVCYRPVLLFWAQLKGFVDYLRGEKGWHKSERNRREAARPAPFPHG